MNQLDNIRDSEATGGLPVRSRRRWLPFLVALVGVTGLVLILTVLLRPREPSYQGKSLSSWLEQVDYGQPADRREAARRAIRAMGTNALPWILREFDERGSIFAGFNPVLRKLSGGRLWFPTHDTNVRRATWGIWALGGLAKPAIPELLGMLDVYPGFIPSALADIGADAIPALQQCLTNSSGPKWYYAGNTIGAIFNAISSGNMKLEDARVFLPQIEAWARSTNTHAARYARDFLIQYSPASLTNLTDMP